MACKRLTWENIRQNRIPDGARRVYVRDGFSDGDADIVGFEEEGVLPEQLEENRRSFMQAAGEVATELILQGSRQTAEGPKEAEKPSTPEKGGDGSVKMCQTKLDTARSRAMYRNWS